MRDFLDNSIFHMDMHVDGAWDKFWKKVTKWSHLAQKISYMGKKVPLLRMGWDGRALLGRPSRILHRNWKIIFVLGADEYRLEGKIRERLFFYVKTF